MLRAADGELWILSSSKNIDTPRKIQFLFPNTAATFGFLVAQIGDWHARPADAE